MENGLFQYLLINISLLVLVAASGMELSAVPLSARRAMDSGELVVERDASDLCGPPHHQSRAFIAAPLTCGEERIGALLFCVPQGPNLINVEKRLRSVYGGQCVFAVNSSEQGSTVAISVPLIPPGGLKSKQEGSVAYAYRGH